MSPHALVERLTAHGVSAELAADLVARARGTALDLGAGEGSAVDPGSALRLRELGCARLIEIDFFRAHAFPPPRAVPALRLRADATQGLPIADGSIDLSVCMHVLEHLREPQRALREIARTLAHDGLVVIAVPDGSSLSDRLFRAYYRTMHSPRQPGYDPHVQCLRSQDVERLAANAGLRVLERVTISESFAWLHKHPWLRRLLTKTFAAGRRIAPRHCCYGSWWALAHRDPK